MSFSKQIARSIIFPTIIGTGTEKIWRDQSPNKILNIMYHGVVKKDSTNFSPRHIQQKQFEQHLKYFKKHFDIIHVDEAFNMVRNNITPKRHTITISFDDGYENNLETALPLLEKYNIPTSFYVCSFCVENNELPILWSDIIAVIKNTVKDPIEIDDLKFIELTEEKSRQHITDFIKLLPKEKRDIVIQDLIDRYNIHDKLKNIDPEIWRLMNKEQLQRFARSSVVKIGSHGHYHYNLGNIDLSDANEDMSTSKRLLEATLNTEINSIAYPDGSYTTEVKTAAKNLGFANQLAVNYKLENDNNDSLILNRHGVSSTTTYESNMFFINKAFKTKGF